MATTETLKGEHIDDETQLRLWVEGQPVHRQIAPGDSGGVCTPDFSCCRPELLADRGEREAYARADDRDRHGMLSTFLGRLLAGKKAHVAGAGDGEGSS